MSKKVLIIAYNYLPMNNGGVQRPVKFSKYLYEYGYESVILTNDNYGFTEEEENIYRVHDIGLDFNNKNFFIKYGFKILKKMLFNLGIISGNWFLWQKKVCSDNTLKKIIEKEKIDIVYATFPPVADLLLGYRIKKKFNIPLVVDFRDGFVFESIEPNGGIRALKRKKIENKIINQSDYIITIGQPITNYFKKKYDTNKVKTIENGFDSDDFNDLNEIKLDSNINLVYTGRFSKSSQERNPYLFFEILDELMDEHPYFKNEMSVYLAGNFTEKEKKMFDKGNLKNVVNIMGFIPRKKALELQKSGDILLLLTGSGKKSIATSKLFEYLYTGNFIFGLTKNTVAEDIITKTNSGICKDPQNKKLIKSTLINIIKNKLYKDFSNDREKIQYYSRKEQTKRLAEIFDKLI